MARSAAEPDVAALNAAAFAHTLFSLLRQPALSFTEAFAMANHTLRAHGCSDTGAKRSPIHPVLVSAEAPELPGTKPQPIPHIEGVDLSLGFSRSVPGASPGAHSAARLVSVHTACLPTTTRPPLSAWHSACCWCCDLLSRVRLSALQKRR